MQTPADTEGSRTELRRFGKFLVVGAITWTVDVTTLNILQLTVLVPEAPNTALKVFAASAIAFLVGILINFILNRQWTFNAGGGGQMRQQALRYSVVVGLAIGFRLIFVLVSYQLIGELATTTLETLELIDPADATTTNQIGTNAANILSIPLVMLWNFFGHKYFTYRK